MSQQKPRCHYKNVIFLDHRGIYIGGLVNNKKQGIGVEFAPNRRINNGQPRYNQFLFEAQMEEIKQLKAKYQTRQNESVDHLVHIDQQFQGILQKSKCQVSIIKYYATIREGQFINDQLIGFGLYKQWDGVTFVGYWANGSLSGYGKILFKGGHKYAGEILNYKMHGFGIWTLALHDQKEFWVNERCQKDETRYEGFWKNSYRTGYGKLSQPNGEISEGEWENDEFVPSKIERQKWLTENCIYDESENRYKSKAYEEYFQAEENYLNWYYQELQHILQPN